MAHGQWKEEKKEEMEQPRGLQRGSSTRNKKTLPIATNSIKKQQQKDVSSTAIKLNPGTNGGVAEACVKRSSLLDQVSALMRSGSGKAAGIQPNKTKEIKSKPGSEGARRSIRHKDGPSESKGADPHMLAKKVNKGAVHKAETNRNVPARSPSVGSSLSPAKIKSNGSHPKALPTPLIDNSQPALESNMDFMQTLETTNEACKQQCQKNKHKHHNKKLSNSRQLDIHKELAKRKELKAKRKEIAALHVDDDHIEQFGWFTLTVKENSSSITHDCQEEEGDNVARKKKKKGKKQLRSTVDYSRDYGFTTRQDMEERPAGYYQKMIGIKKRQFHVDNLFTSRPLMPRVYHFDSDAVNQILDKREDQWWIKSRLPLYQEEDEESDTEENEKGIEVLSVYFGPNEIDHDPDNEDSSVIFSIASVESVHFSDDDENQDTYKGKLREKVEVMPGELKILRKEEETLEAIANGTYMSSLCLGCSVALVSVQDAREVACPTCGSITPLNGVCLTKPFGIATGIKRVKVEHLLTPRKSPFFAASAKRGNNSNKEIPRTITTTGSKPMAGPPAPATANEDSVTTVEIERRQGEQKTDVAGRKGASSLRARPSTSRARAGDQKGTPGLRVRPSRLRAAEASSTAKLKSRPADIRVVSVDAH